MNFDEIAKQVIDTTDCGLEAVTILNSFHVMNSDVDLLLEALGKLRVHYGVPDSQIIALVKNLIDIPCVGAEIEWASMVEDALTNPSPETIALLEEFEKEIIGD